MELCTFNVTLDSDTLFHLRKQADQFGLPVNEYLSRLINRQALLAESENKQLPAYRRVVNMKKTSVSLAEANPLLAQEFDQAKNFPLTPETIGHTSTRNVWWKCRFCGTEYQQRVGSRIHNPVCSFCYNRGGSENE